MSKILVVRQFGESLVVTIPKSIAELQNMQKGTKLELTLFPDVLQLKIVR